MSQTVGNDEQVIIMDATLRTVVVGVEYSHIYPIEASILTCT